MIPELAWSTVSIIEEKQKEKEEQGEDSVERVGGRVR